MITELTFSREMYRVMTNEYTSGFLLPQLAALQPPLLYIYIHAFLRTDGTDAKRSRNRPIRWASLS